MRIHNLFHALKNKIFLSLKMNYFLSLLFSGLLILSASSAFALEPENLFLVKQKLMHYHDSGAYEEDQAQVIKKAMNWMHLRVSQKKMPEEKLALVLDIDETSLSNYPHMKAEDFGGSIEQIRALEDEGDDPVIRPTKALYDYAISQHVSVFFLTGRIEADRQATEKNLKAVGYQNFSQLILRSPNQAQLSAQDYKAAERQKIEAKGYTIIENIGDQESDLRGGHSEKTFKLPNPYYFIP